MTDIESPPSGQIDAAGPGGVVGTAKEQAGDLAASARSSAADVAGSAKQAADDVAGEARRQAKDLLHESRTELIEQAGAQQQRVAAGLRSLGEELDGMARSSDRPGLAADLVSQAAGRADTVASWLDARDPGSLLTEVKEFARRSPGTFIGLAALAGVVAGRLGKNLAAGASDDTGSRASHRGSPEPAGRFPAAAGTPSAQSVPPASTPVDPPTVIGGATPAPTPVVPSPSAGPNVGETTNQFGSDDLAVRGAGSGDAGVGDAGPLNAETMRGDSPTGERP